MQKKHLISGLAVLALAGAAGAWWLLRGNTEAVQYRTAKLDRGPLLAAIAATGAVSPVTQVTVGTQVSGQIKELYVDFNAEVKAGQLIAQIDPETFEYRVRSAQADVDAARAVVLTAQATALAARAQVSSANTDLTEAKRTHERNLMLVSKQFIAQSEADKSNALVNTTQEALKAAQAQVGVADAQVKSAQASVAQRQAALAQARIDLDRTRITSPVNGIVVKRSIERGQTVAASLQSPELFIIAQNLREMQVEAAIDEADVGRIRNGQKATFTVDAFPGQTFEGQVAQVRKAALNVANVVTYVAVVTFSNNDGRLLPGMTANVRVVTDTRESVLKVPNAALRVRIAGVEPPPPPAATPAPGTASTAAPGAAPASPSASGAAAPSASSSSATSPSASPRPAGAAGASQGTEFRNRLVSELKLDDKQIDKVDAIYAAARPKFMPLRDLPEAERGKARERITAEIRASIAEVLTPEQKAKYATLVSEAAGRTATRGRIYLMNAEGKPRAVNVRLGISDGTSTELLVSPNAPDAADLTEGAVVVIGTTAAAGTGSGSTAPRTSSPRLPF